MAKSGDQPGADPLAPTYSPSGESGPRPERRSGSWTSGPGEGGPGTSPFIGRVLGARWEVGERIGSGGMATVHSGRDLRLERQVAIKILHPHVAESPEARERLAREARAIAQLKHENVIEVYDYASDDPDCTWLVTELIEGKSLRQFLDRHPRPMPEIAVMIVTELVRALRAAHEVGVIHRDVKPDNILVGKEGRPKLSDFGIAKVLNEAKMTVTGNLVGSPSYMSPEQADGLHTDHRTDLFSAAVVLYRLVTGTLPFRGATPLETIRKVSRGEYQDPVELSPESSGAVAGIIRRGMAANITERYQNADDMIGDLVRALQDAGLSAVGEELPKYFQDPVAYQAALRPRLLKELEARGRALLDAGEEGRALDCFNRALSLGEGSHRTLDLVKELSKRRGKSKLRRALAATGIALGAVAGIAAAVVVTDLISSQKQTLPALAASENGNRSEASPAAPVEAEKPAPKSDPPALAPAQIEPAAPPTPAPESKSTRRPSRKEERARAKQEAAASKSVESAPPPAPPPPAAPESPPPAPSEAPRIGNLQVGSRVWVDVYLDGHKVGRAPDRSLYPLPAGPHKLRAVKPDSDCHPFESEFTIRPGETTRLRIELVCP